MANDLAVEPGPDVGPSPADFIIGNRRASTAIAIGDLDANPDDAARAIQLSQATGVPAPVINADLPGFEHQHKARLVASLLNDNDYLRTFVDMNPMAAKIANDDYANLDAVSQRVSGMGMPEKIFRAPEALGRMMWPDDPLKRFTEGGRLGSWVMRDPKAVAENPFKAAVYAGLGIPIELVLRGLGGIQMTAADAGSNLTSALGAPGLGREFGAMIEQAGLTGRKPLINTAHEIITPKQEQVGPYRGPNLGPLQDDALAGGRMYLENGREPPPGVLPEYDAFRAERNVEDVKSLEDVVKDAQASLVRERNPDLFRDFIARHTDADIGIGADAVIALYGDKTPLPDDGLLGWVPGIEDKLALARASGDDISIPLADWVAKVDPEVMKALSEDIRVRPGAITAREAMLAKEMDVEGPRPPPLPEEAPTIRSAAGLEPMLSVGDRKLKLIRPSNEIPTPQQLAEASGLKWEELDSEKQSYYNVQHQSMAGQNRFGPEQGFHDFDIMDDKGNNVGALNISVQDGGKTLYVDNIYAINGLGPRDFGPALMRDLMKQIKAEFPEATKMAGHRVSGARETAGKVMDMPLAVVKLDVPKGWDFIETWNEFRQVLEGGQWETFSPRTKAYIKPQDQMPIERQRLAQAVNGEIARLVPQKLTLGTAAERIESTNAAGNAGRTIEPGGVYIRYPNIYPVILASLEGVDPIGSARHEAIHHLRQYGFFNKAEWATLEAAAMREGWLDKHGIHRRYPTGDHNLKLEESIAEAFTDWMRNKTPQTPEVQGLFERLKALFDSIKARISEMLGREATWEDIFKKVDTGEVGRREGTQPIAKGAFNEQAQADRTQPVAANDVDATAGKRPSYTGATNKQRIERFIDENTIVGDFDHWQKIAEEQGTAIREGGSPNAYAAARAASLEGKTSMIIDANGRRVVYKDGIKVARELNRDVELGEMAQVPAEPSRVFERAMALGMSKENFARLDKLQQQKFLEDLEASQRRVDAAQRKTQSAEWKANRAEMRKQVVDEIDQRPDIAADNYFADGMLYGKKVEAHEKLGTDFLTPEQRTGLPRDYYRKDGVHPDDLAPLFGYPDGASLVAHLSGLSEVRRQSGMRPIEFKRRMIDIETDRQMRLKYGVLEDNILDAVKEQVASETQLSILHEETLYYAEKAKLGTLDKDALTASVREEFEKSSMTSVSSDRYMATAGRAQRAVESALLKQDYEAVVREKQKQFYAMTLAKEAIAMEVRMAKFEKLVPRLAKREVKQVAPEYLDYIHGLLAEAGVPIKRSLDEIAASKEHYAEGKQTLGEFVNSIQNQGRDLDQVISEALQNEQIKPLDQMSVAEMRDFMDAVTALNHVGRKVQSIEIAGKNRDRAEFRQEVVDNLKQLTPLTRQQQQFSFGKLRRIIDAPLARMEEILKDADLRKELGPLHQAVIEPLMRSKAKEFDMFTDLSKYFQEVRGSFDHKWRKSLNDTIEQDIIMDPYTSDVPGERVPYDMTRENLINVMLNWGNRSNIGKMVQSAGMAKFGRRLTKEEFPTMEAAIKALIDRHATQQDWNFVTQMWQPFKKWQPEMETVSRNTVGVVPKMIESAPVETPFGTLEGGFWPVKYDRLGSNISAIEERKPDDKSVFGGNYFRAATAKGYLKERTGYVDFVDINTSLEQAVGTMQQTMHDIAFRDELLQASNILYDKGIRAAMARHMGEEYVDQLIPWLRDIAHQFSSDDKAIKWYTAALRRMRINLVGHALPLNLKVILSPDIGTPLTGAKVAGQTAIRILQAPLPKEWATFSANREANVKLAMEKSDEIRHLVYNMDRDYRESLSRITLDPTIGDFQKKAVQWGFVPISKVSQEFRVATFVSHYKDALGRGLSEVDAAAIADSAVRERHGAASIVDLPAIMRGNEGMKMLTTFYGFFNTMYNWQRQIPGNIRRGEYSKAMENYLGSVVVGAAFGAALFNQRKENDDWFKIMGKALLMQPLSTVPGVREATSYLFEGFLPRTPLASLLGSVGSIINDGKKLYKGERPDKPIQHVANVIGLSTGLPLAQIGRTGQFGADVYNRRQRPKNIAEWARGIITGESKLKR